MKRTVRSDIGEVTVRETGLVYAKAFPGAEINLKEAKEYHSMNELLSINTSNRIILDLRMAEQLVAKCIELKDGSSEQTTMVFDMSKTAFITEEARTYITGIGSLECGTRALALVSDNHLGNVVSTLMIAYGESDNLPMKLFKSYPEAENWLMQEMKSVAA